jgi:hypothetical protein
MFKGLHIQVCDVDLGRPKLGQTNSQIWVLTPTLADCVIHPLNCPPATHVPTAFLTASAKTKLPNNANRFK